MSEPKAFIRRCGGKERGHMAWEAWVEDGVVRFAGEYGTYAWTEKRAQKKAQRLLAKYIDRQGGPTIHVRDWRGDIDELRDFR